MVGFKASDLNHQPSRRIIGVGPMVVFCVIFAFYPTWYPSDPEEKTEEATLKTVGSTTRTFLEPHHQFVEPHHPFLSQQRF